MNDLSVSGTDVLSLPHRSAPTTAKGPSRDRARVDAQANLTHWQPRLTDEDARYTAVVAACGCCAVATIAMNGPPSALALLLDPGPIPWRRHARGELVRGGSQRLASRLASS